MNNRNPKIRRRDFAADVYENFDQDFNQLEANEIISVKFQNNDADIVFDRKINHIFTPGNSKLDAISTSILMSPDYWHSITIHHQGVFSKDEINQGLEELVNNNFFIPIAYRSGKNEDTFLINNQSTALNNMIYKNLEVIVTNKRLSLTLKLGVAIYKRGHINAKEKIDLAIADVISKFREYRLDFSHFHKHRLFADMQLNMKNKACFDFFCDQLLRALCLVKYNSVISNLRILVLVGMNIKNLQSLSRFVRCNMIQNISLKNNAISSIEELEALKPLRLKYLSVAGNPFAAKNENNCVADQILKILETLEKLDIRKVRISETQEPAKETIIMPNTTTEEVLRAEDITDNIKNEFPRKEYVKAYWNKVVIEHNGKFEGHEILDEMFRVFFEDIQCYPCYYQAGELEDSFKLHNRFEPLDTLVQNNLKMRVPGSNEIVTFRLHLKIAPFLPGDVKYNELISKVIDKRMNSRKLDLSNFRDDPEFRNVIINMSSNGVKRYVLSTAVNKNLKLIEIDMSNNQMWSCKGLDFINKYSELISLNLSNNKIESLDGLPQNLKIVELSIGKNPFCDQYKSKSSTPYDYVQKLLEFCPKLQYIDGRKIDLSYKMIHMHNYFPTAIAYPAIERFINFYFKSFDILHERSTLLCNVFYRPDSILSVTQGGDKSIVKYGFDEIRNFFISFPSTEHDLITMTVDTPLFNNRNIMIVVNGVFKQKPFNSINDEDILQSFSRTFLLRKEKNGRIKNARTNGTLSETYNFEIQNEMLQFNVLTDSRIKNKTFKKQPATEDEIERIFDDKYTAKNEFDANLELFRQTTLLTDQWCLRFMQDAHGDFKMALNYFIEFFKRRLFKKEDFKFK